jgi:5-formyltetrahydrofolate cyclo-ligase
MSKTELRAALRKARKSFVDALTAERKHQLESQLASHLRPIIEESTGVGGYHAVGSEIDVGPALAFARSHALPTFDEEEEIFRFRLGPAESAGPHGIPQPPP